MIAEKIKNEKIRNEIIAYYIKLEQMELSYQLFQNIVINDVRAYLRKKELLNLNAIFELDSSISSQISLSFIDAKLVSEEDLKIISKDPEFQQLLFELNAKWHEFNSRLDIVIEANKNFRELLKSELKDY